MVDAIMGVQRRRRNKRWRWLIALSVLLALGAGYGGYSCYLKHRVAVELAKIRGEGYPVSLAELNDWYPQPKGRNAAHVYLAAFRAHVEDAPLEHELPPFTKGDFGIDWPARGQPLPPAMTDAATKYLRKNADELRLLLEAATIPESKYPTDFTSGVSTPRPHLDGMSLATKLLAVELALAADRNDAGQAEATLIAMLRLAESVRNEPWIISQLARISVHVNSSLALERAINRVPFHDQHLARLSANITVAMDDQSWGRSVSSERCLWIDFLGGRFLSDDEQIFYRWRTATGLRDWDLLALIEVSRIELERAPRASDSQVDLAAKIQSLPTYARAAKAFVGLVDPTRRTYLAHDASVQTAIAGLAARRYQIAKGQLPDRLDELVPIYLAAVPTDPFDGKPLRLRRSASGVVIYSVGKDGADNGGTELDDSGQRFVNGTDITFTIEK